MAELYFQHKTTPYIFDTRLLKLFRLENSRFVEILNPETKQKVRLHSIEINREQALRLAGATE
jgi:hypothetical protein